MEPKKRSVGAAERDEFLRVAWRVLVAARTQASRFVFVDECSTNTSLAPLYAWSPKGQRARCKVPRNYGPNVTLFASMTHEGMGPCLVVEGATTSEVFETYIEQMLRPALRPGQIVVVMDNLSSHKRESVGELIEERGCELLYPPPYSPDLNPIEGAFSKVKGLLREAEVVAVGVSDEVKVSAGDVVVLAKYSGTEVKIEGEEHLIVDADDILAVVEG